MLKMNNSEFVEKEYSNESNFQIRRSFQKKYSTNKYGEKNWQFDFHKFFENCTVLELGCGLGDIWENRQLPNGTTVILSDLSERMLEIIKENKEQGKYKGIDNVLTQKIDIQNIPYEDNSFDIIIANRMLYHVPDIDKAIEEVYRVLKPNGIFYTTTIGIGIESQHGYLHRKLKEFDSAIQSFSDEGISFTVQNGMDILKKKFNEVELYKYEDSLEVTETKDLMEWMISSTTSLEEEKIKIIESSKFFEKQKDERGIINIPKQVGMFIATK